MTCIVYRNGMMACDSRAYGGDKVPIGRKCKIRRLEDGTLIGVTSTLVGANNLVMDWYAEGMPLKPDYVFPDNFTLIAAKPDGQVFMANNRMALTGPLDVDYVAIGSGEEYALGAMAFSDMCDAISAVITTCKLDIWSDLPIYFATHSGQMPKVLLDISPNQLIQVP